MANVAMKVTPSSVVGDTMLRIGEGNLAERRDFKIVH